MTFWFYEKCLKKKKLTIDSRVIFDDLILTKHMRLNLAVYVVLC